MKQDADGRWKRARKGGREGGRESRGLSGAMCWRLQVRIGGEREGGRDGKGWRWFSRACQFHVPIH